MSSVEVCRKLYNTICDKFPPNFGKALSRRERDKKELFLPNLVYSEISFDALGEACKVKELVIEMYTINFLPQYHDENLL